MKSIDWLALTSRNLLRVIVSMALVAFAFGCADNSEGVLPADAAARKNKEVQNSSVNSNSTTSADGYCIVVTNEPGSTCWTYTITRKPGAKAISHFIINLDNCPNPAVTSTLSIDNILNPTVNGNPAVLSDSEGNTGCILDTESFVKFDDLEEADVYIIKFTLDAPYGNFVETRVWIKAGESCHHYTVEGPCCPLG